MNSTNGYKQRKADKEITAFAKLGGACHALDITKFPPDARNTFYILVSSQSSLRSIVNIVILVAAAEICLVMIWLTSVAILLGSVSIC